MRTRTIWAVLLLLASCATATRERCPLLVESQPPRLLPPGFAEVDALLIQRAQAMGAKVERLNRSLTVQYREEFLGQLAPKLCELLTQARTLAYARHAREAGTRYQGLIVVSMIMQLEVAMLEMASYADALGQVSTQIAAQLALFDQEMRPLMAAALSMERARLLAELPEGLRRYEEWLQHLDLWAVRLKLGHARVEVARVLWDTFMATAAVYDMAGSLANVAASAGRPPPAIGALAGPGVAAVTVDGAMVTQMLEAIRKLIASGALDSVVVAGIGRIGHQMAADAKTGGAGAYLSGKAPMQVAPGTRVLDGQYVDETGRVQPWRAYYDEYGRLVGRTDFNAGNKAQGIPDVHHHRYEWGAGKAPKESGSHLPGEYEP